MINPIFHGPLLNPEHFMTSYFFLHLLHWRDCPMEINSVRPLLHGARTDCGSKREHGWIL